MLVGNPNVKSFCGYDFAELKLSENLFADNLYHVNGQGDQKGMMPMVQYMKSYRN